MKTFEEIFDEVAANLKDAFAPYGFALERHFANEGASIQSVFGGLLFFEKRRWIHFFKARRYVSLSVAPLRLEIDLLFGCGIKEYTLYELYELERVGEFPRREHDLYEARHDGNQLQLEFERLIRVFLANGSRFINNDRSLWRDLLNQSSKKAVSLENERLSKKGAIAFKAQNWREVVRLFKRRKGLSELDQKRLNYAQKKLSRRK